MKSIGILNQQLIYIIIMNSKPKSNIVLIIVICLMAISQSLYTSKMVKARIQKQVNAPIPKSGPNIKTSCTKVDLSNAYNYMGIVYSGYLNVKQKGDSALAYTFYGQKDVKDPIQLKNYPTILWLSGGPGRSSQMGNLQQIGPLLVKREQDIKIVQNNYTWANNYNLLFIDQPVGTGLSYADTQNLKNPFTKTLEEVAEDLYQGLNQLYNGDGCFSPKNLNIPGSSPLFIFGEGYGGKYATSIAKKIIEKNAFLTGLRGVAIGNGFTSPYQILTEVGAYSYNLGLLDYQQRMRLEKILLNASRHQIANDKSALHLDFDSAIDYIAEKAGDINVYDIKIDGQYENILQAYFNDESAATKIYLFNEQVVFDSQLKSVYDNLYIDFITNQISKVEFLLGRGIPILVYNGQDDLIVQNAGTIKWTDRISYSNAHQFRHKLFDAWKYNNKVVGYVKSAGLLEFRIVNGAGHMVPMDKPIYAEEMAKSFIRKVMSM